MKVISLLQPWATLVVIGAKKIETRSWNTKHRGEILIHASAKFSDDLKEIASTSPFREVLIETGFLKEINHGIYTEFQFYLPKGAIIGKANLIHTLPTETIKEAPGIMIENNIWELTENEECFGDYSPNRYGWLLSDPVQFDKSIPAKGQLSIWNWEGNII